MSCIPPPPPCPHNHVNMFDRETASADGENRELLQHKRQTVGEETKLKLTSIILYIVMVILETAKLFCPSHHNISSCFVL